MKCFLGLLISFFLFSLNFGMAQSQYDFEDILGVKLGSHVENVKDLGRYESTKNAEEKEVSSEDDDCFIKNFVQYSLSEIVAGSPERLLVNFSTIDNIIVSLDIVYIQKTTQEFNNFIDQNYSELVTKWGKPIYSDGSYNALGNEEYSSIGYHFKPNNASVSSIVYNQDGWDADEYRLITIAYKSRASEEREDTLLGCSFSFH